MLKATKLGSFGGAVIATITLISMATGEGRDAFLSARQEEWGRRIRLVAQQKAEKAGNADKEEALSYQRMEQAFNGAPEIDSLDVFAGEWLLVAEAVPGARPGRYDWNGLRQRRGWVGRVISAKPPFQNENGFSLTRGHFDAAFKTFKPSDSAIDVRLEGRRGGSKRLPGYSWTNFIQGCGDCATWDEWEPAVTYEFRSVVHKNADYVIEKATVGDEYKPETGKGGGAPSYYGYRRLRPAGER